MWSTSTVFETLVPPPGFHSNVKRHWNNARAAFNTKRVISSNSEKSQGNSNMLNGADQSVQGDKVPGVPDNIKQNSWNRKMLIQLEHHGSSDTTRATTLQAVPNCKWSHDRCRVQGQNNWVIPSTSVGNLNSQFLFELHTKQTSVILIWTFHLVAAVQMKRWLF